MGSATAAGIGITEETDAIAVIVSEEIGRDQHGGGGKIERDLTVEQLREHLSTELRRYMSPVALPTVVAQNDESDEGLRAEAPMSADRDSDSEMERPL